MNSNEKPVLAATRTRAKDFQQPHDTHSSDYFQCPRCRLTGNQDVFSELDWPQKLLETITRNPGLGVSSDLSSMSYQDARYLYNWLLRKGVKNGRD